MSIFGSVIKDAFRSRASVPAAEVKGAELPVRQQEGGTILCFYAGSEGDALREHSRWSFAPLEPRASKLILIDCNKASWVDRIGEVLTTPIWFAAGFFGCGEDLRVTANGREENFWSHHGIPFVRPFGDLPAYFPDKHIGRHANSINTYGDPTQSAFYRRWFRDPVVSVTCPPLIVDRIPLSEVRVDPKKQGTIIFPKNGNSEVALRRYWRAALPQTIAIALERMAEESTAANRIGGRHTLDDLVIGYFSDLGIDVVADRATLCFLVAQLDDFLRRVKSRMIAEALLDLPVIIRGSLWEHIDFSGRRATYDPDSDVARTQALIDRAPALIDMSPNTHDIPHDRVRRAIGRGTAFITNTMECFVGCPIDTGRFTFDFNPGSIRSLVEHYVTRPQEAIEMGLEQSRLFRELYTDQRYAEALAGAVNMCAMRLRGRPEGTQNFVQYPPTLFS